MSELVKVDGKEVLISNLHSLSDADDILYSLNEADSNVLDVYVHNAITRGEVYHKITEMINEDTETYFTLEDIGLRYGVSKATVINYVAVSESSDYLLSYDLEESQCVDFSLKPTLAGLLGYIKASPEKVAERLYNNIHKRKYANRNNLDIIDRYFENVSEDIRSLMSNKKQVSLGKLADAITRGNEQEILEIIRLDGSRKNPESGTAEQRAYIKKLEDDVEQLMADNSVLKTRIDFLLKSISASAVTQLLRRISVQAGALRKFKYDPQLLKAFDILGVDADVTVDGLKKAYYAKVKDAHPDVGGDEEMFKNIVEANARIKQAIKDL